MESAQLQDVLNCGYTQIGRIGNTVYLSKPTGHYLSYTYVIVKINNKNEVIDAVGLSQGQLLTGK